MNALLAKCIARKSVGFSTASVNTMSCRWVRAIVLTVSFCGNLTIALHAQNTDGISDREACQRMKNLLPLSQRYSGPATGKSTRKVIATQLTRMGFILSAQKAPDIPIAYVDVANVAGTYYNQVSFDVRGIHQWIEIDNDTPTRGDERKQLSEAIAHLAGVAKTGKNIDCSAKVSDSDKADLDDFARDTAGWRALSTKPMLSDEVIKKRLLAEDAIQHQNLQAASSYYEAGVAINPTWAQGWYNAALLYGELQKYSEAAFDMKHYLILLPDAPDAAQAKERLLLWEAKAEEARSR